MNNKITDSIWVVLRISMYYNDRQQAEGLFREVIVNDPHFIAFNYYQSYRVGFVFTEEEDWQAYLSDIAFKLSMGANKNASILIIAMSKGLPMTMHVYQSEYPNSKDSLFTIN